MGPDRSLDLVVRDRRSGSVLLATSLGAAEQSVELGGLVRLATEPGSPEGVEVALAMTVSGEGSEGLYAETIEGGLVFFDQAGSRVGPRVDSYTVVPSVDGKYELHSGIVTNAAGDADMFVISDVIPIGILIGIGAACLILYSTQVALIVATVQAYKKQGLVPKIKMRSGAMATLTCRFEIDIEGQDPHGNVVQSTTVKLGPGGSP